MKHTITTHEVFEKQLSKQTSAIRKTVGSKIKSVSSLDGSNLQVFLTFVLGLFQPLLSELSKSIQWTQQLKEYLQLKIESEDRIQRLKEEQKSLNEKVRKHQLNNEKDDISYLTHVMKRWKAVVLVIAVLLLTETGFNVRSFQIVSSNLVVATIMSAGLGICFLFCSHFISKIVKKYANNILQHILLWVASILVMTIVFYFIGSLRMVYFTAMNDQNAYGISTMHFMVINLMYFIVAALLSSYYSPTEDQRKKYLKNISNSEKLEESLSRLKEIEKELKSIPKELSEKETLLSSLLVYIHEQEIHIEGLYLETVQTALLDYQLQTGNKLDVLEIPNLNRQYLTTNIEDYV